MWELIAKQFSYTECFQTVESNRDFILYSNILIFIVSLEKYRENFFFFPATYVYMFCGPTWIFSRTGSRLQLRCVCMALDSNYRTAATLLIISQFSQHWAVYNRQKKGGDAKCNIMSTTVRMPRVQGDNMCVCVCVCVNVVSLI